MVVVRGNSDIEREREREMADSVSVDVEAFSPPPKVLLLHSALNNYTSLSFPINLFLHQNHNDNWLNFHTVLLLHFRLFNIFPR